MPYTYSIAQMVYMQCHIVEPLDCVISLPLSSGPDGTELILTEGGVHSLNFAIACDSSSNKMAGPFLVNTQEPEVCEAGHVSRVQRESQFLQGFCVHCRVGAGLLGWCEAHSSNRQIWSAMEKLCTDDIALECRVFG